MGKLITMKPGNVTVELDRIDSSEALRSAEQANRIFEHEMFDEYRYQNLPYRHGIQYVIFEVFDPENSNNHNGLQKVFSTLLEHKASENIGRLIVDTLKKDTALYPLDTISLHFYEPNATMQPHYDLAESVYYSTSLTEGLMKLHDTKHEITDVVMLAPGTEVTIYNAQNIIERPIHSFTTIQDLARVSLNAKHYNRESLEQYIRETEDVASEDVLDEQFKPIDL
jgi:hypothetical protein